MRKRPCDVFIEIHAKYVLGGVETAHRDHRREGNLFRTEGDTVDDVATDLVGHLRDHPDLDPERLGVSFDSKLSAARRDGGCDSLGRIARAIMKKRKDKKK